MVAIYCCGNILRFFILTPKSLVEGRYLRSLGAATAVTSQGARTPDWPAQPATKPRAPSVPGPLQAPVTLSQMTQWKEKKTAEKRGAGG